MEEIQNVCDYLAHKNNQRIVRSMESTEHCERKIDMKLSMSAVENALNPLTSKIEMEVEPIIVDMQLTNDVKSEYVKLNDLKDTVEKLVSYDIMEDHIKHFDERMQQMEKVLEQFSEKIEQLSIDLHNLSKTMEPVEEIPMRLVGEESKSLETIQDDIDEVVIPKSKESLSAKQRNYNKLFQKFKNQTTKKHSYINPMHSSSKLSLPDSQVISQILDALPFLKRTPSPPLLEQDLDPSTRYAAEQRQFETNMLMYRKSQFSLRLNSRINKLAKKFWDSSDFLGKKPLKRQADKRSQTEETQSSD